MLRWFGFATLLCALSFTAAGCGGSKELPPKTDGTEPKMSQEDAMKKAMQGAPPEAQKRMAEAQKKMNRGKQQ